MFVENVDNPPHPGFWFCRSRVELRNCIFTQPSNCHQWRWVKAEGCSSFLGEGHGCLQALKFCFYSIKVQRVCRLLGEKLMICQIVPFLSFQNTHFRFLVNFQKLSALPKPEFICQCFSRVFTVFTEKHLIRFRKIKTFNLQIQCICYWKNIGWSVKFRG